ncbi:MAG: glycosyl hydrolase, partial [Elusimicrobia bacterium]
MLTAVLALPAAARAAPGLTWPCGSSGAEPGPACQDVDPVAGRRPGRRTALVRIRCYNPAMPRRRVLALLNLLFFLAPTAFSLPKAGSPKVTGKPRSILRQEWFYNPRSLPDGSFAPSARFFALQALGRIPYSPLQLRGGGFTPQTGGLPTQAVTRTWEFLGPRPLTPSTPAQYGFGNTSVKINAIALHPTDLNVLYIGSFGGILKSTDGGSSWNYASDGLPSQAISSIAIDTAAPNIVYAGTGDPTFAGRGVSLLGVGLYRSSDSGATWGLYGRDTLEGQAVHKVAIDPETSGSLTGTVLYAALRNFPSPLTKTPGLYKSSNSGQTWTLKTSQLDGLQDLSGYDVAVDTTSPGRVFYCNVRGLYRSNDYGETWSSALVVNEVSNSNILGVKCAVSLAGANVYYSNSDGAFTGTAWGGSAGSPVAGKVFRSTDGGATFSELTAARGFCGTQCSYDQIVGVDPVNQNRVFLGGVEPSSSTDSGQTWTPFAKFSGCGQAACPPIHSDFHSIAFHRANTDVVYLGNDGGLWRSNDGGLTWANKNDSIPGGLLVGVSVSANGKVIGGLQDNGNNVLVGAGPAFAMVYGAPATGGGDGGYVKIDQANSNRYYYTYVIANTADAGAMSRTDDDGATGTSIVPAEAINGAETSEFYPPLFMSHADSSRILTGFNNAYRSLDAGANWTRLGGLKAAAPGLKVTRIHEAPSNPNYVYAAMSDGSDHRVYVTKNAGLGTAAGWTRSTNGLPTTQVPASLAVHPTDPKTLYVTYSQYGTQAAPLQHVYKSTDAGTTFVSVSSALPDVPFHDIVVDTAAPNSVFAASDVGVFNSIDGGKTWGRLDLGMPTGLIVNALWLHSGTRQLVAGTYGRGVFKVTLPDAPPPPSGLAAAPLGASSISWNWSAS